MQSCRFKMNNHMFINTSVNVTQFLDFALMWTFSLQVEITWTKNA